MIKTKAAFLEGRLLSIHLEQLKKYSKSSDYSNINGEKIATNKICK